MAPCVSATQLANGTWWSVSLRELGAQQDETDLRTIAMSHHDSITLVYDRRDITTGFAGGAVLIQYAHVLAVLDQ